MRPTRLRRRALRTAPGRFPIGRPGTVPFGRQRGSGPLPAPIALYETEWHRMQHAVGSPLPPPHQPGHGPAAGWSPAAHHPGPHFAGAPHPAPHHGPGPVPRRVPRSPCPARRPPRPRPIRPPPPSPCC
ncbi:Pro-rich N-terminal domain-containing protein [Streptomyces mexicanus]|uniref:Pro-rich N-terminal domain-containing protein n=1 Tax=Streptomyces mexicanus TaxID=178566 RepID=UPI0034DD5187